MTLPEQHLAEEAVTAYVDGLLSPAAEERARRHLAGCPECGADVQTQREVRALLRGASEPCLPAGLMSRLLDVPMTAPLDGPGSDDGELVLSADGGRLGWAPVRRSGFGPRLVERTRPLDGGVSFSHAQAPAPVGALTAMAAVGGPARRPAVPAGSSRPGGHSGPGRASTPVAVPRRLRRHRRGLAVSLAGLAFGVIASAATTTAPGTAAPAPGTVLPGQTPAQLSTVNARSPLHASTFRFSGGGGRSAEREPVRESVSSAVSSADLVDRAAAPR